MINNQGQAVHKDYYLPHAAGLLTPLEQFLNDITVSEIVLNSPGEIFVEQNGQFIRYELPALHEANLAKLFQLIANENKQLLSSDMPLLSGNLHDGSRVQLVLPPTAKNYTFAIRRQTVKQLTLSDYATLNFYQNAKGFHLNEKEIAQLPDADKQLITFYKNQQWDDFIRASIQFKKNIVISGGTSSGKTTFLNACLQQIPLHERLITIEDTREIEVPHKNQVNLLASKGEQAQAKIDMQALVQCCLRLRPDRIIMGEIRGKEILDFLGACSTGHEGSITTIHANNPQVAFMRMTQLYKQNNVPSMTDNDILRELHEVIDVIIQLGKTEQGRQVQSIYYKYGNLKMDPSCR